MWFKEIEQKEDLEVTAEYLMEKTQLQNSERNLD